MTFICVVMTCCACDCHYGGVCYACGVCCWAGYADSVNSAVLLLLVTASVNAVTMVCATSVMNVNYAEYPVVCDRVGWDRAVAQARKPGPGRTSSLFSRGTISCL